jgi:hypothetical protein
MWGQHVLFKVALCVDHVYCLRQHYVGTAHIVRSSITCGLRVLFKATLYGDCLYFLRQRYKSTVQKEKLKIHSSELHTHTVPVCRIISGVLA